MCDPVLSSVVNTKATLIEEHAASLKQVETRLGRELRKAKLALKFATANLKTLNQLHSDIVSRKTESEEDLSQRERREHQRRVDAEQSNAALVKQVPPIFPRMMTSL